MSGGRDLALDEDYHVHSTFSDGESSIVQNVRAARERGLRTLCLVDHVRRGTEWLPEFNEKWACPSARTVAAMARAGVPMVAGTDSHHCRDVGVYRSVRVTAGAGIYV
jgi:histidinol phosphatase-like PHP family hydrolase